MARCACGPPNAVRASPATSFRKMMPRTRRVRLPERRGGGVSETGAGEEVDTGTKISRGKPRPYRTRPFSSAVGCILLSCHPTHRHRFRATQPYSAPGPGQRLPGRTLQGGEAKRPPPTVPGDEPHEAIATAANSVVKNSRRNCISHKIPPNTGQERGGSPAPTSRLCHRKKGRFPLQSQFSPRQLAVQPWNAGPYSLAQPPTRGLTLTSYF